MTSLALKLVHERVGISDVDYPESACCKHINGSVESRTSSADEGAASSLFTLRYIVFIVLRYSVGSRVWDSSSCSCFDYSQTLLMGLCRNARKVQEITGANAPLLEQVICQNV